MTLEPADYLQTETPGCQDQLVFDIGPDELTGTTIVFEVGWYVPIGTRPDCSDYDATLHLYHRTPDASFELVDFRVLEADENCRAEPVSAGVGDRLVSTPGPNIFLTPSRHALGLRVIGAVLDDCTPAPLTVRFAQEFE